MLAPGWIASNQPSTVLLALAFCDPNPAYNVCGSCGEREGI